MIGSLTTSDLIGISLLSLVVLFTFTYIICKVVDKLSDKGHYSSDRVEDLKELYNIVDQGHRFDANTMNNLLEIATELRNEITALKFDNKALERENFNLRLENAYLNLPEYKQERIEKEVEPNEERVYNDTTTSPDLPTVNPSVGG